MVRYEVTDPARMTSLALRLSVEATRPAIIREIETMYRDTGSLPQVAKKLGVAKSTLDVWIGRIPELRAAIERVRSER